MTSTVMKIKRYFSARVFFWIVLQVAALAPWICSEGADPGFPSGKVLEEKAGYMDVVASDNSFVAVGTGGRIDLIRTDGSVIPMGNESDANLNSVITDGPVLIAAGNSGTVLLSADKRTFSRLETGTGKNIISIVSFEGLPIALTEDNLILVPGDDENWIEIRLQLKGRIIALSTGMSVCAGATDRGEIISSGDALNWEIFDYNEEYSGFGKPCIFTDIAISENTIAVSGYHNDNSPVVLFSTLGNVWMERTLNYKDEKGIFRFLHGIPVRIAYDVAGDQFFTVTSGGDILCLPQCTKCNTLVRSSIKNPGGLSIGARSMMITGKDFSYEEILLRDQD